MVLADGWFVLTQEVSGSAGSTPKVCTASTCTSPPPRPHPATRPMAATPARSLPYWNNSFRVGYPGSVAFICFCTLICIAPLIDKKSLFVTRVGLDPQEPNTSRNQYGAAMPCEKCGRSLEECPEHRHPVRQPAAWGDRHPRAWPRVGGCDCASASVWSVGVVIAGSWLIDSLAGSPSKHT